MSSFVELCGSGLPPKDPAAHCDACGCVGTVSRAIRLCDGVEQQHFRFCATCWVEESARLRARWDDEDAQAQDAAFRTRDQQRRPSMGSAFESATWHGARAFFSDRILPKLHSAEPFSAKYLRSVADRYRVAAPDMVGDCHSSSNVSLPNTDHLGRLLSSRRHVTRHSVYRYRI